MKLTAQCKQQCCSVLLNFDLGERFPRPRSQQRGSLCPCTWRGAVLGLGMGGVAPSHWGGLGCHPQKEIFDAKSCVWGQFGPENKLIESQPNEYDVICRNASVLAFHLWPTIFAGAPFRLQTICWNGVPPRSRTTTLLLLHMTSRVVAFSMLFVLCEW